MALAPSRPRTPATRTRAATARRWREASDDTLVRGVAIGDAEAAAVLHARYRAALERYCRTIVLHREDAEDAAQAALAAAMRALGEGRTMPHAPRAWLYRIAHREALAVLRRRPPAPAGDEALDLLACPREDAVSNRARLAGLLDALRALPERTRSALVLHELGDLSFEEIGETLGTSPAAARQAAYEARAALRGRREDLHVLFPAGPALALSGGAGSLGAGGSGAGLAGGLAGGAAVAGGGAAAGTGGLGAIGAWILGSGAAAKCAAVCAAVGVLGAGSYTVVHPPAGRDADRPAASPRSAERAGASAADSVRLPVVAPAGASVAGASNTAPTADERADRTRARREAARARRDRAAARARRDRIAARRDDAARPDPSPPAAVTASPDVTDVTVEESPTGGAVRPDAAAVSRPADPAPAPVSAPTGTTRSGSPVGDGAATTTSPDVVSVVVEAADG